MNKTVHSYIFMCLIVSHLFGERAVAGYPFAKSNIDESIIYIQTVSDKVQKSCLEFLNPADPYTAENIHLSSINGFNVKKRSACLFPLIAKTIISEVLFFKNKGLVDTRKDVPLLFQILFYGSKIDIYLQNTSDLEKHLSNLITAFWIVGVTIKDLEEFLQVNEVDALISNFNKLRYLSYSGSIVANSTQLNERYKLPLEKPEVETLFSDLLMNKNQIDVAIRNSGEVACILNPSNNYCPQKILFTADVKSNMDRYILGQKFLRDTYGSRNFSSQYDFNIAKENLCLQLVDFVKSVKFDLPAITCNGSNQDSLSVSIFIRKLKVSEDLLSVAILFNQYRLSKVFPWGDDRSGSGSIAMAVYRQDLSYSMSLLFEETEIDDRDLSNRLSENMKSEMREIRVMEEE